MIKSESAYQKALEKLKEDLRFISSERKRFKEMNLNSEQIDMAIQPLISFHEQLKAEVAYYERIKEVTFSALYKQDDNYFTGYFKEIDDLIFHGGSKELMIKNAVESLMEYTEDYLGDLDTYLDAPNRKGHFMYVQKVAQCESYEQVLELVTFHLNSHAKLDTM